MATTLDIVLLLASSARLGLAALPPRLTRDGPAALWGFPGLSHQAVDYAPARGALGLTKPDMYTYIQTVATCESAMAAYNRTATTSAIYDETGARAPGAQVGAGTPLCICFSLGGAPGKMDLCVHVLGDGTPEGRGTLWYDDIAGGTYVSNANKALPQCGDIDVAAVSASVYAALGAASPTANAAGASGAPGSSGAAAPGRTVYATAPAAADGSDGLSRSDKIALGVGLGMGLPAILLAAWGLWYLHKSRKEAKLRAEQEANEKRLHSRSMRMTSNMEGDAIPLPGRYR